MMLCRDFVAFPRLHGRVFPVDVVGLGLNELDVGIGCEDLLEHIRCVMKRKSDVTDLSLRLQLECLLIGTAFLEFCKVFFALRVH